MEVTSDIAVLERLVDGRGDPQRRRRVRQRLAGPRARGRRLAGDGAGDLRRPARRRAGSGRGAGGRRLRDRTRRGAAAGRREPGPRRVHALAASRADRPDGRGARRVATGARRRRRGLHLRAAARGRLVRAAVGDRDRDRDARGGACRDRALRGAWTAARAHRALPHRDPAGERRCVPRPDARGRPGAGGAARRAPRRARAGVRNARRAGAGRPRQGLHPRPSRRPAAPAG